jgi:outer membrane biosynthesis protein TonB
VGNPVFLAAAQLRAAIARRLGADVVDSFAIPQRNEDGDTIDWYAPAPGPVVPWSAATPDEQARAKERLLEVRERIEELARTMQAEPSGERQVFGRLLEHVTTFPGDEHVYLVDDRPVVTFWGFLENDAPVGSDPLLNLPVIEPQALPPRRRIPWWVWLLLALLLLALLYLLWRAWQTPPPEAPLPGVQQPAVEEPPAPVPLTDAPSEPVSAQPVEEPPVEEPPAPPELPPAETRIEGRAPDQVRIHDNRGRVETDRTITEVQGTDTQLAPDALVGDGTLLDSTGVVQDEVKLQTGEVTEGDAAVAVGEDATGVTAETGLPEEIAPLPETALDAVEGTAVDLPEGPADALTDTAVTPETPVEPPQDGGTPALQPPVTEEAPPTEPPGQAPDLLQSPETDAAGAEQAPTTATDTPPDLPAGAPTPKPGEAAAPGQAGTDTAAQPTAGQAGAIPSGATTVRTVRLLNSGWRTRTSLQDPRTGLPVKMEYSLKDGAGRVELKRADGSVCGGDVKAAVQGGSLMIDSTGNIVCPDGTNFGRPTLECQPGKDGRADCRGRYPSGETFSVDITQEPK